MSTEASIERPAHPAPFNDSVLSEIRALIQPLAITTVLDPFAGVGKVHALRPRYETYGIELEKEWSIQGGKWTVTADSLRLMDAMVSRVPLPTGWPLRFDACITSPSYGNRMADHHDAKDPSKRTTYKHKLGRDLSENNSGGMQWGEEYRAFHSRAWGLVTQLVPDGYFVLNMKDHIRGGERQLVTKWHIETLLDLGWRPIEHVEVSTSGNRFGANHHLRVSHETVTLFERQP